MEIVQLKIDEIKPCSNNTKLHTTGQIQHLVNSIKRFGFQIPIIVSEDYVILAGHGRYFAAIELKLETVPCRIVDHLSEEQQAAYRIVDNSTQQATGLDSEKLNIELKKLFSFDMKDFGFNLDFKENEELEEPESSRSDFVSGDDGGGSRGGSANINIVQSQKFKYQCPECKCSFDTSAPKLCFENGGDDMDEILRSFYERSVK